MSHIEKPHFPPSEVVKFTPSKYTTDLLKEINVELEKHFKIWKGKMDSRMSYDFALLKDFLREGEQIKLLSEIRLREKFILVTAYPRTQQSEELHVAKNFVIVEEDGKRLRKLVTDKGRVLNLGLYVIIEAPWTWRPA